MVTMTRDEWRQVGKAIVVWSGWGQASHPLRDDRLVMRHFGGRAASLLLPLLREVVHEFYASDACDTAVDLAEMGRVSAEQFSKKHPDAPRDAVRALAWCYTFDNK